MGCDIHFFVEVKRKGAWHYLYEGKKTKEQSTWKFQLSDPYTQRIGRNYTLYAFLAGVRNREKMAPLCQPRGLPKDTSKEVNEFAQETMYTFGGNQHHSWFTLEELNQVNWTGLSFYEEIKNFKTSVIDELNKYVAKNGLKTNELRAVFWFDNA